MIHANKKEKDNKNQKRDGGWRGYREKGRWVVTIRHWKARSSGNIPLDLNEEGQQRQGNCIIDDNN